MTSSEVFAVAIAGAVVLILFFICFNNIKYHNKEKKKKQAEAKKNTQPVADISPKQVDFEKDLEGGEPLNVDDPIFTKKGYENITDRLSLQAMIDEEKAKDNAEIKEKLSNIELSNSPNMDDYYEDMVTKSNDLDNIDLDRIEKMTKEMETQEEPKKEDTVDIIKQLIEKEKLNDKK